MAEAAQAQASAAISPTDIKQEPNPLDGFDFSLSPDMSSKRPFESAGGAGDNGPEAKRPRTGDAPPDTAEDEAMSLIVQNALTDINNIISSFGGEPDGLAVPTTEPEAAISGAPAQGSQPDTVNFVTDPTKFVRDANIHALATIAISMLLILSHDPFDQVAEKMRDPASEQRLRFQQLHRSLEALRLLYSERPILLIDEFDMHQTSTIIRLVNLAQLGWWIFDGGMESLREVDLYLPTVFRDEIIGLPTQIVDLLVSVKTHRAIRARQAREDKKLPEADLTEIFLENIEQKLREQNIADQVIGSDKTVTDCLRARMEELRGLGPEADPSAKYPADGMLRSLGLFSRDQLSMATELGERLGLTMPPPPPADHTATHTAEVPEIDGMDLDDLSSFFEKTASGHVESVLAGLNDEQMHPPSIPNGVHTTTDSVNGAPKQEETPKTNGSITDYKELEALVAESTSNYVRTTLQVMAPTPYQPTVPTSTAESMAAQSNYMHNNHHHTPQNTYYTSFAQATPEHEQHPQQQPPPPPVPGQNLPPNQTCSTSLLYEKARQAALSKQTAHPRREGNHSTRRPWSQEEEKALMTGLDMVKGPHWSQILSLFGPNGTVSDILKDRTQVQLKDKARNLKLFFLKTNSEMPYYLNLVTGELKTRAPTQAARKEAEERARLNSEDEQSRLQGAMASPGGLHQNRTQAGAVGPVGSGVVTPAQAAAHAAAVGQHRAPGQPASVSTTPGSTAASTPTTYNRLQGQATNGQSVPQPPPRPQSQLPPQIPRPQPQPQPQPQRPPQQAGQAPAYGSQNTVHQTAQQIMQQLNLHQSSQSSQQPAQRLTPTQASPPPPQAGSAQQSQGSSATTPMATPTNPSPPPNNPPSSSSGQPQYPHQYNQHAQSAPQSPAPGAPPQVPSAQQSPATPAPAPATPQPDRPAAPPDEQLGLDKDSDADLIRNMEAVAQSIWARPTNT